MDTEGIKIGLTTRHEGKKVLTTTTLPALKILWGNSALSVIPHPEHARIKKMLHPTISVSGRMCV